MNGQEIKGRLDRIGKTALEHFQDIKELEVADEQGLTVKDIVPYKCEIVWKSLKALEIIKEKNVNVGWFKAILETKGDSYACYLFWVNYTAQPPLTEEEFNLLKEVLE